jgi:hypothetical protein
MGISIRTLSLGGVVVLLVVAMALAFALWSQATLLRDGGEMYTRAAESHEQVVAAIHRTDDVTRLRALALAEMQASDVAGAMNAQIAVNTARLAQWLLIVLTAMLVCVFVAAYTAVRGTTESPPSE